MLTNEQIERKEKLEREYNRFGTMDARKAEIKEILLKEFNQIPISIDACSKSTIFGNKTVWEKRWARKASKSSKIPGLAVYTVWGFESDRAILSVESGGVKASRKGDYFIVEANGKRRMATNPLTALYKCYGIY